MLSYLVPIICLCACIQCNMTVCRNNKLERDEKSWMWSIISFSILLIFIDMLIRWQPWPRVCTCNHVHVPYVQRSTSCNRVLHIVLPNIHVQEVKTVSTPQGFCLHAYSSFMSSSEFRTRWSKMTDAVKLKMNESHLFATVCKTRKKLNRSP